MGMPTALDAEHRPAQIARRIRQQSHDIRPDAEAQGGHHQQVQARCYPAPARRHHARDLTEFAGKASLAGW